MEEDKKFCKHCGEKIDKDSVVCPKCGRQLKLINNEKATDSENMSDNSNIKINKDFYKTTAFMWIMLVFFPPLGITLMWVFHNEMKNNIKIILTIIFGLLFILIFAAANSDEESTNNTKKYDSNKVIEKSKNTEKKATKKSNVVFKWESTGDIRIEGKEETKILEVGKDIEEGNYLINYNYKDYTDTFGQGTTNKWNRYYTVIISNTKISDINGENINKLENDTIDWFNFYPEKSVEKNQKFNVKTGNYIYIHHSAKKEAGYGTLTITKK